MPKSHAKYSKLKISFICVIPCEVDCTRTLGYKKDVAQSRKNSFFFVVNLDDQKNLPVVQVEHDAWQASLQKS